jgi:protein-S-isoprenylcysteine O-methyltransferase Ste14
MFLLYVGAVCGKLGGQKRRGKMANHKWTYWIYYLRNFGAALPLLFAFICNYGEIETYDRLLWGVGGAIFLSGMALRIWSQQHLHYRMGIHKQLTTSGPYSLLRNPLYIANTLTYVGVIICSELVWLVPITVLWAIGVYSLVIRYEETHLVGKYGNAYQKYLQEVPRWVPKRIGRRHFGLTNEYLKRAVWVELRCVLILLPYILKEMID